MSLGCLDLERSRRSRGSVLRSQEMHFAPQCHPAEVVRPFTLARELRRRKLLAEGASPPTKADSRDLCGGG